MNYVQSDLNDKSPVSNFGQAKFQPMTKDFKNVTYLIGWDLAQS